MLDSLLAFAASMAVGLLLRTLLIGSTARVLNAVIFLYQQLQLTDFKRYIRQTVQLRCLRHYRQLWCLLQDNTNTPA